MEKALAVDPTVYEYDNIYDDLQAKKAMSDKRLASNSEHKVNFKSTFWAWTSELNPH